MILPPSSTGRFPVRIVKETQPAQSTQTNKPKETQTTKPTKPAMVCSKEDLPSIDEILTRLGLGRDGDKAVKKRFQKIRYEFLTEFIKKNKIDEKSLKEWSEEQCRNTLRKIAKYFLFKGGSALWPDPPHNKSRYIFSKDSKMLVYPFLVSNRPLVYNRRTLIFLSVSWGS
jgi:hypothetical protein